MMIRACTGADPDRTAQGHETHVAAIAHDLDALSSQAAFCVNDLALSGSEICGILGIAQGPEVGHIKALLFEKVLADPSLNTPETLAGLVRELDR